MSQDIKKRPRDNRHLSAPVLPTTKATHVAASVQQAIQRDPLQAMPGDEAAQRKHPVMQAIDLLINYDGNNEQAFNPEAYHEAGRQLQTYHAEQMGALQQASGRAEAANQQLSEFVERVAGMMDIDLIDADMNAQELLEVLQDRLNPPAPYVAESLSGAAEKAGAHLHDVCTVLAKHFGDDPAVTFENAAGLVKEMAEDAAEFDHLRKYHSDHVAQLKGVRPTEHYITLDDLRLQVADILGFEKGTTAGPEYPLQAMREAFDKQQATVQQQSRELREYVDPNVLRQLVSDFGGGLVDNPLEVLREILTNLQKNQMPDGWQAHSQTLIDSNLRYEQVLATMRNLLSLA